jgi:hypothetical protein
MPLLRSTTTYPLVSILFEVVHIYRTIVKQKSALRVGRGDSPATNISSATVSQHGLAT